jgi:hypothetical protein
VTGALLAVAGAVASWFNSFSAEVPDDVVDAPRA